VKSGQGAEAWSFRKALVALDLSPATDKLVAWLPNLRLIGTTTLLLLHVIPETPLSELLHVVAPHSALTEAQRARAVRLLSHYASKLSAYGFDVETLAPKHGSPARLIVETAILHDVDYIIVGSKGHGSLRSILLGSTAEEVVNTADRTVLLVRVRDEKEPPSLAEGPILAAIDFDLYMDTIISCAYTLAERLGRELIIVHVLEPGEDGEEARLKLEEIADTLRKMGLAVTAKLLEQGKPAKLVIEEAERYRTPLLLVGPGSPSRHTFLGVTGEAIVRRAPTNVMVCRRRPRIRMAGGSK